MSEYSIVLCTCPDIQTAEHLATLLVEHKVAACVNMIENIHSVYMWENKLCKDKECLLIIKSTSGHFNHIETVIKKHHPYSCPEIISVPVTKGTEAYLDWIDNSTR